MTPDQIFSIVNLVALAGWVLLAVLPGRQWVGLITTAVIPATLAVIYGQRILGWMKSDLFQAIVIGFTIVAVVVTVAGIWTLIRQSRKADRAAPHAA